MLENEVGIVAPRMRMIVRGNVLRDEETPLSAGLMAMSLTHIVTNEVSIREKITENRLRANCRECETPGALFEPRPLCGACGFEGVEWTNCPLEFGVTTWEDLLSWTVTCPICDDSVQPASIGFLCVVKEREGGPFCCSARFKSNRLQFVYRRDDPSSPSLLQRLTEMFSYPFAMGLTDTLEEGDRDFARVVPLRA